MNESELTAWNQNTEVDWQLRSWGDWSVCAL